MMYEEMLKQRQARAEVIAAAGGLENAIAGGRLGRQDISLSEAVVLGLLRQEVKTYFAVFGHGSTDVAEVLRLYQEAGLLKVINVRNEIEASHAAAALRWVTREKAAVITSIGPGALQALAASIVPASDGLGVWYLFGDETTEDEGPNMQQIPGDGQHNFLRLCSAMGAAYVLHTPLSLSSALRHGRSVVDHPYRQGPFFLLLPMNTQPQMLESYSVGELPGNLTISVGAAEGDYRLAAQWVREAGRIVVRVGGGAVGAGTEITELLDIVDGVAVISPLTSGVIPFSSRRNMTVGGSKGSLCGNYAMENADLLIAIGSRFVCQSDCSRTAYLNVKHVININADISAAEHYNNTVALVGDAALTVRKLIQEIHALPSKRAGLASPWLEACGDKKREWDEFKNQRYSHPVLYDEVWKKEVFTQPAAIKIAADWARDKAVIKFFDAGDVQANGFQVMEDETYGATYTETGASYMGFAVSALLASAAAGQPFYGLAFTGDGSFTMSPQALIDCVQHGVCGCILLFDNRRMAAISGLQQAQYGSIFATSDSVQVDYVSLSGAVKGVLALAGGSTREELEAALDRAYGYRGLSLVYIPVYFGDNPLGGMGVYGRWNVGNWCESTQALRHQAGL